MAEVNTITQGILYVSRADHRILKVKLSILSLYIAGGLPKQPLLTRLDFVLPLFCEKPYCHLPSSAQLALFSFSPTHPPEQVPIRPNSGLGSLA